MKDMANMDWKDYYSIKNNTQCDPYCTCFISLPYLRKHDKKVLSKAKLS